jgi:hypothetical protein
MIDVAGSCHCGAVQFTVRVPQQIVVSKCNCSICSACGFLHYIVPGNRFTLTTGGEVLTEYRFNTRQARHLFCSHCGVKAFYVPRSNPDGYSINANCVNWPDSVEITEEIFDGLNWEENAHRLKHLSEDTAGS